MDEKTILRILETHVRGCERPSLHPAHVCGACGRQYPCQSRKAALAALAEQAADGKWHTFCRLYESCFHDGCPMCAGGNHFCGHNLNCHLRCSADERIR